MLETHFMTSQANGQATYGRGMYTLRGRRALALFVIFFELHVIPMDFHFLRFCQVLARRRQLPAHAPEGHGGAAVGDAGVRAPASINASARPYPGSILGVGAARRSSGQALGQGGQAPRRMWAQPHRRAPNPRVLNVRARAGPYNQL